MTRIFLKTGLWAFLGSFVISGAISVAAGARAQAADQAFHFWARIPQAQLSCQQEAQAAAARFTKATSRKVTEAKCLGTSQLPADGKNYSFYSIDLTYQAEAEAQPYIAIYGSGDNSPNPRDSTGGYQIFDECLSDLSNQAALFERQTGLSAVSAGCEPGRFQFQTNYVLKITGFGRAKSELYAVQFDFHGVPSADFVKRIQELVIQSGGTLARVWGNQILYYAAHPVSVQYRRIENFEVASQCEAQLDEVRAILGAAGARNSIMGCLSLAEPLMAGWVSLEGADDSGVLLSTDFGGTGPKYFSFDECMNDRARVIHEARAHGRTAVLGGVCHRDSMNRQQYVDELFERL